MNKIKTTFFTVLFIMAAIKSCLVACTFTPVGSPGFNAGNYGVDFISLYIYNGTPYVAYTDYGIADSTAVMTFNGSAWVPVGSSSVVASDGGYWNSLFIYNGTPYLAKSSNNSQLSVMKFDGTNWSYLGPQYISGYGEQFNSLFVYNGIPYIAYTLSGALNVMMFNGTNWVNVGTTGYSATHISLYVYNGTPYIAYSDGANSNKLTVRYFDGANWNVVGAAGFSPDAALEISLVFDNAVPYVSFEDSEPYKPSLMQYNGSSWVYVGTQDITTDYAEYPALCFYNNTPYVAYDTESNSTVSYNQVMTFTGSGWSSYGNFGPSVYPSDIEDVNIGMDINNCTMYVAYLDGDYGDGIVVEKCGSCGTPTETETQSGSVTATLTPSATPTITISFTFTPTDTYTNTPSVTPTCTVTQTCSATPTQTFTKTPSPSTTATNSPTATPTTPPFCFELKGVFPNPAQIDAHIIYKVCRGSDVDVVFYTVSGEVVRRLHQQAAIGWNSVQWDMNNSNGHSAADGVYVYSIEARSGNDKAKKWGKLASIKIE